MKNISPSFIAVCLILMALLTPSMPVAQETVGEVAGSVHVQTDTSSTRNESGIDIIGLVVFIVISVSIPAIISYALRIITQNNMLSYLGTYVVVVICYAILHMLIDSMPAGSIITTASFLLILSMLGSLVAQWIYLRKLPKKKIVTESSSAESDLSRE